jgi:large subunit ribosomal protein L13
MLAYHRSWRHINGENHIVGRLATNIASLLMGKHKPIYDPACTPLPLKALIGADCGDHVVVTNAKYLLMTGRKTEDKVYYRHSGRPGHLKVTPLQLMIAKKVHPSVESGIYSREQEKSFEKLCPACYRRINYGMFD